MKKSFLTWALMSLLALSLSMFGCDNTESDSQLPSAKFKAEPTMGQTSLPVKFTDLSSSGSSEITERKWDFGDGTTSSEKNPHHLYDIPGKYTVSLYIKTDEGTDKKTITEYIAVSGNDIIVWNNLALNAMALENWMPPMASRGLAMLHAAIYDAVNAVEKAGQIYHADVAAEKGACKEAALARAAYRILSHLLPLQSADFDEQLAMSLNEIPDGASKISGIALGDSVATAIINWRADDGSVMGMPMPPYTGGTDPGEWRPTPAAYAPGMFVHWSDVVPFAMTSGSQFRPGPRPALTSTEYATDFNEVKTIGSKTSATRTMDQSMMAAFWVGMPGTIMETGRINLIIQQAADVHNLTLFETARLFALVNIAMADAAIAGIDCKYFYSFWRPVTAIWEAAGDSNPDTVADLAWEPYIGTPAHPEYISTHSTLTKAAATVMANFFGEDTADITLPSFMDPAVTRHYTSFSQVAEEAGLSRIYGGIHFRFSYIAGSEMGRQIGEYVWLNFLLLQ